MKKKIRIIHCDGFFDFFNLKPSVKILLFPILAKHLGILRTTLLLYKPGK